MHTNNTNILTAELISATRSDGTPYEQLKIKSGTQCPHCQKTALDLQF